MNLFVIFVVVRKSPSVTVEGPVLLPLGVKALELKILLTATQLEMQVCIVKR